MLPEQIELHNIGPHKETIVDFRGRDLCVIIAENGRGKSYILGAIIAAVWGVFPGKGKIHQQISWGFTGKARIVAIFKWDGDEYKVERTIWTVGSKEMAKTEVRVWKNKLDGKPFQGPSASKYTEWCLETFGPLELVLASSFAAQESFGDICTADRNARYSILAEMTGTKGLLQYGKKGDDLAKPLDTILAADDRQIDQLQNNLADHESRSRRRHGLKLDISNARKAITSHQDTLDGIQKGRAKALAIIDKKAETEEQLRSKRAQHSRMDEEISKAFREIQGWSEDLPTPTTEERYKLYTQKLQWIRDTYKASTDRTKWESAKAELDLLIRSRDMVSQNLRAEAKKLDDLASPQAIGEQKRQLEAQLMELEKGIEEINQIEQTNNELERQIAAVRSQICTMTELKQQAEQNAELLTQIPQPDGICKQCPLTQRAYKYRDSLPGLNAQLIEEGQKKNNLTSQLAPFIPDKPDTVPVRTQLNSLPNIEDLKRQATHIMDVKARLQAELDGFNQEIESKVLGPEPASVSGQDYSEAHRIENEGLAAKRLIDDAEDLKAKIKARENEMSSLKEDQKKIAEAISSYHNTLESITTAQQQDEPERKRYEEHEIRLRDARAHLERLLSERGELKELLRADLKTSRSIRQLMRNNQQVRYERDCIRKAAAVFTYRTGIGNIIRLHLPKISGKVNEILANAGRTEHCIELTSESDSGKPAMDIMVMDNGERHDISVYSPGMRKMFSTVIRIGKCYWRAEELGTKFQFMGIDETFDALSTTPAEEMISILKSVQAKIGRVIAISHNSERVQQIPHRLQEVDGKFVWT